MPSVFISIGSNIEPEANVREALRRLGLETRITAVSTFYRTEPEGPPGQPAFYNGVTKVETDIPLPKFRVLLRRIEAGLGRVRTWDKYAPRTMDLDLLVYDEVIVDYQQIANRAFVAIPLCELAPDLVLPGLGTKICDIAESLSKHEMEALPEFTRLMRQDHGQREG